MKFYRVGEIINTHGIRGEVKVRVTTDFVAQRFASGASLYIKKGDQGPQAVVVDHFRKHKNFILVKFRDFNSLDTVHDFRGATILVNKDDRNQDELEKDQYYYHQIIGLEAVTTTGRKLGTIKEIMSPGANDVWIVSRVNQSDLLLPVIDDVVKEVDLNRGQVTVELLEGLE